MTMKPDYKNRMPKGMIYGFLGGAAPLQPERLAKNLERVMSEAE